jgi:hypothetical protein
MPLVGKDLSSNLKKVKNSFRSKIKKHGATRGTFLVA